MTAERFPSYPRSQAQLVLIANAAVTRRRDQSTVRRRHRDYRCNPQRHREPWLSSAMLDRR
jgi:hypothetical protein